MDLRASLSTAFARLRENPRARSAGRWLRHAPDRATHRLRRRLARRRLRRGEPPRSVLFVCHGNIYRSPFAALAFARGLPDGVRDEMLIDSAGFVGPGRASPSAAKAAALRRGVDLEAHRSSLLTPARIRDADLVVVMDEGQQLEVWQRFGKPLGRILVIGDLDPLPIETRVITDPWGKSEGVLDSSYERLERCVQAMCAAMGHPPAAVPAPPRTASV
jgi:protein-tyrosine phosphatase